MAAAGGHSNSVEFEQDVVLMNEAAGTGNKSKTLAQPRKSKHDKANQKVLRQNLANPNVMNRERRKRQIVRGVASDENPPLTVDRKKSEKKNNKLSIERKHSDDGSKRSPIPDELCTEQRLLLTLFVLKFSQRAKYIEKRGVELGVLALDPTDRNQIVVNKCVQHHVENLFAEANSFINSDSIVEQIDSSKQQKTKVDTKETAFEQQVNHLLANGRQSGRTSRRRSKNLLQEHPLRGIGNDEHTIVPERLDYVVNQLVEQNVGYLVKGTVRVNAENNTQAFVSGARNRKNVFISSIILRQCALQGDVVSVFAKNKTETNRPCTGSRSNPQASRRPESDSGFVVRILETRHNRQCIGTFLPPTASDRNYRTLVPQDTRIPSVRIFKQHLPRSLIDLETGTTEKRSDGDAAIELESTYAMKGLYLAEIFAWHGGVPVGKILKSVDKSDSLRTKNESILIEHNLLAAPYAEDVLAQLPMVPYSIPQEEIDQREDLRGECVFTLDSATARHLDDALSCKALPNGNLEVGVHISDVTYFLREQSELDELAKQRAVSVYMVDTVYLMLPEQLCETCSLSPGLDKLAFSVFWEMLSDGTVVSTRFSKSVINSCAQLSYDCAQTMLDNPQGDDLKNDSFPEIFHGHTIQSLGIVVNQLHSIAVKLRQRRMEDGYLEIERSGSTFWFNTATDCPIEYDVHKLSKTFDVFMVLANTCVAQAIHAALPSSPLIRYHKIPSTKMIEKLEHSLASHGYTFSFASSKPIHEAVESIIAEADHPDAAKMGLNVMLSNYKHFGSPVLMYTNFTSPIRRYIDCMVHRVLAAILFGEDPKLSSEESMELPRMCNQKRNAAKLAGDASLMLCYCQWLNQVKKHETVGAVIGYDSECIKLILFGTGIIVKIWSKKKSSFASIIFPSNPVDGSRRIQWLPKNDSLPVVTLKLFSKVLVTITLVKGAITVCSLLPVPGKPTPTM